MKIFLNPSILIYLENPEAAKWAAGKLEKLYYKISSVYMKQHHTFTPWEQKPPNFPLYYYDHSFLCPWYQFHPGKQQLECYR